MIINDLYTNIINDYYVPKITNKAYFYHNLIKYRSRSNKKLKILFSRFTGWIPNITYGFRHTQYQISFEDFNPVTIGASDLIVPLTIEDINYLNKMPDLVKNNLIPIPTNACVALCDDKFQFNQFLTEQGFGEYIPAMNGNHSFPYIVKKRQDACGQNSYIIKNREDEQLYKELLSSPMYFSQNMVLGQYEYATHIIFKNNKIVSSLNVEYKFNKNSPIKGKDQHIYKKFCKCPHLELFESILASIGYNGLCCVNYKMVDKKPLIIEINPRFGGSLCESFFYFLSEL
jgi:predicted ATP-grasp superfamily ATP-dependent carboligase